VARWCLTSLHNWDDVLPFGTPATQRHSSADKHIMHRRT
jgi:hypothetical protein